MIIIKIGGGKDINIKGIAKDIRDIYIENNVLKEKIIVVMGANYFRDELANKLKIEKKILNSVKGFSSVYSDEEAIDLILMAYSGLRNKRIVETFLQHEINAIGLSGIDGKLIIGKRNQGIRVNENGKIKIVRDFSGKPKSVNYNLLNLIMENNYIPILSIPILDENNFAINSENDDIVSLLNDYFNADTIINFIEEKGFLENKNDPNSIIKRLTYQDLLNFEEKIDGRIKRKIYAIGKLFDKNQILETEIKKKEIKEDEINEININETEDVNINIIKKNYDRSRLKVIIADGRVDKPIKNALLGNGTIITFE